jgi:peptidoglycan hydrolase-like protein with peptidoglycan-binding domain
MTTNLPTGTPTQGRPSIAAAVGIAGCCALAVAGVVAVAVLAFGSHDAADAGSPHPTPGHSTIAPDASVASLQRQLAQLNYYNGPVNGVWNVQTSGAISYLQRDAQLPQTGRVDSATQAALNRFLRTGNNQMAG